MDVSTLLLLVFLGSVSSLIMPSTNTTGNIVPDVGFQATQRGKGSQLAYHPDQSTQLKFDTVDYNNGGGYNSATGMFQAPVSGVYKFWLNVRYDQSSQSGDWIAASIIKGQQVIARGYSKYDQLNEGVASTEVVTHLNKGDYVYFTTESGYHMVRGAGYSSYGGSLLIA